MMAVVALSLSEMILLRRVSRTKAARQPHRRRRDRHRRPGYLFNALLS
jgi:hypothetical protein